MEPEYEACQAAATAEPTGDHQFFSDAEEEGKTYVPKVAVKKAKVPKVPDVKKRYIAFIGNLPYTIEKADLEQLFKDLEISSIRLLSDKVTGKPKGIAFVEFSDAPNLTKALELHQTKIKGRKINIELTVGGGGNKSEARKEKIQAKNQKYKKEMETLKKQNSQDA